MLKFLSGVALVCAAQTVSAAPIILDFDGSQRGSVAEQSGYAFSLNSGVYEGNGFGGLFASNAGAVSTLTRTDGGAFDLLSIVLRVGDPALDITFTGLQANGATVSQRYQASGSNTSGRTAALVGFTNLASVTFAQGSAGRNAYIFDLAQVQAAAAVPEPASWAMMIGGFGLVGGSLRRRAKVRTTASYA